METSTRTTTAKIRRRFLAEFLPFGEQLRNEGCDDDAILAAFRHYCEAKRRRFLARSSESSHIADCLAGLKHESTIESRLFYVLDTLGLKLRFQYEIAPYKVDCLIEDFLVLEIDRTQHDTIEARRCNSKRDRYLRSLGYQVFRAPVRLVELCTDATVAEIQEIVLERKSRSLPRGGRKRAASRNGT